LATPETQTEHTSTFLSANQPFALSATLKEKFRGNRRLRPRDLKPGLRLYHEVAVGFTIPGTKIPEKCLWIEMT